MTLNIFKTIQRFRKNRKGFSLIEISVVILIIGVLIAGISQASDMIDDAALKGARTASKGSRVGRIKDLVLWLDAVSDGASLTAASKQAVDGDAVTQLKDLNPRSSAKLTLTSAGTSIFNSNKVSGLPGLNLSGGNFFKLTDRFDNSTIDYTIYLVYQPVVLPASGTQVIFEKRSSEGAAFPYRLEIDSNGFYKFSDSAGVAAFGAKKASTGKVNIIRLSRSSTASLSIVVDDVPNTAVAGSTSAINSDELIIGAKNAANPTNHANGRLGELIIFERDLASSEEADIETYLFKKWKIEKDATKAGVCSTSTVANSVGTMAVGATSFSCLPGYAYTQPGAAPGCSAAPDLAFTAGTATCTKTSCIAISTDKIAAGTVVPVGTTCPTGTTCKSGTTGTPTCNCASGTFVLTTGGCT